MLELFLFYPHIVLAMVMKDKDAKKILLDEVFTTMKIVLPF